MGPNCHVSPKLPPPPHARKERGGMLGLEWSAPLAGVYAGVSGAGPGSNAVPANRPRVRPHSSSTASQIEMSAVEVGGGLWDQHICFGVGFAAVLMTETHTREV